MNALGKFIFVTSASTPNLSPEALARLVLLATYTPWGKNCLRLTQRRGMTKADLASVLRLSTATANRFFNEASPAYLVEGADGTLSMRGNLCRHGQLSKEGRQSWRKLYVDTFRSLYAHARPSQHKLIGYLLGQLGALNLEHNCLCRNPAEIDPKLVEPLTAQEFCAAIGHDPSNFSRLRRYYESLRFEHAGCYYKPVVFGKDGIWVNPRVSYNGGNYAPLLRRFK